MQQPFFKRQFKPMIIKLSRQATSSQHRATLICSLSIHIFSTAIMNRPLQKKRTQKNFQSRICFFSKKPFVSTTVKTLYHGTKRSGNLLFSIDRFHLRHVTLRLFSSLFYFNIFYVLHRAGSNIPRAKIWEKQSVWWLNYRETKMSKHENKAQIKPNFNPNGQI